MRERTRRSFVERLEDRNLLTGMPFGALPDDTAEYMLGDVYVNVVLMESDSSVAPFDVSTENWTAAEKASVKSRITDGLKWWEDTLDRIQDQVPNNQGRHGLLNFTEDWTYLNSPVRTGYEPITRTSQEFANWVYDFLGTVGFNQTGNFLTDLRAYNNAQRIAHNSNWAFTIFVVDDSYDLATDFNDNPGDSIPDYDGAGRFAPGSAFSRSFAYAGGNAFVMPGDRPASIVAHETGHMFWALDEYNTGSTAYQQTRGYYNTQNTNSTSNPGSTHVDSIMSSGARVDAAYDTHTSSTPSLEMIGWKDSDGDGIFDVLDVKFSLTGTGKYNSSDSTFTFVGKSKVRTLLNENTSGLRDDITINQIDRAEYSIDGGTWTTIGPYYHKYATDLNLEIPVIAGTSQIKIRTVDDRTGVTSVEYVASLSQSKPQNSLQSGISGYVFNDNDGSGIWDGTENGLAGWTVQLLNPSGQPLDLHKKIDPDSFPYGALLNYAAAPEATLSAQGGDVADDKVNSRNSYSASSAGRVFFNNSITDSQPVDTWNGSRQLRIDFTSGVSEVNIKAISSGSASVGRLEIYNASGVLLDRYTTGVLNSGKSDVMKLVRPQGDIAYAVASGHAGTKVVLDNLEWGATSSTTTDSFGYYNLGELGAGQYRVAVVPKLYHNQTFPSTPYHLVDVPDALSGISQMNFGFFQISGPWHNPVNALDVTNDGSVSAVDALAGINYINTHDTTIPLPPIRPPGEKYYDVNNDGYVSAVDILLVINQLNKPLFPPPTGEGGGSGGSIGGGGLGGSAGGELDNSTKPLSPGATLATQYYSQNPLQVLKVPGAAGCGCDQCTTITEVAAGRVSAASSAKSNVAAPVAAKPLELQSFAAAKKGTNLQAVGKVAVPHIDGSLLHTIAAAAPVKPTVAVRRGRR
ncbi:MAG: dockerin type I domain-containing protein [Pirellulaceae bacterium]